MDDDDRPIDGDARGKITVVIVSLVLVLAGALFLSLGPFSTKNTLKRRVERELLNYRFPPKNERLSDLLPSTVDDVELDADCESYGRRYGYRVKYGDRTMCRTSIVTLVTASGERYSFHTGGGFIGPTFTPANETAHALVYGREASQAAPAREEIHPPN